MSCQMAPSPLGPLPTFTHRESSCHRKSDPINIIAPSKSPFVLRAHLSGSPSSTGGKPWGMAGVFSGLQSIIKPTGCGVQDEDLANGGLWERVHVRLWRWDPIDGTVGAAHHEFGITLGAGPRNLIHRPTSYDTGRDTVFEDMTGRPAPLPSDLVDLGNYVRSPHASGTAALV